MGEKHLPEVTAHQAPSPALPKHMEYIVVGEKYILRISPASFQMHSTPDYYRCHEKWAFALPRPTPPQEGVESAPRTWEPEPASARPGTQTLQLPRSGCFSASPCGRAPAGILVGMINIYYRVRSPTLSPHLTLFPSNPSCIRSGFCLWSASPHEASTFCAAAQLLECRLSRSRYAIHI